MTEQRRARGGKNSQFISKLVQILEDQGNSRVIKYDKRRKQLIVFSKNKLEAILPSYFKHGNFQSFARQLNWYGFHKIRGGFHHIFQHPELKKGKSIEQLKSKRKSKGLQNNESVISPSEKASEKNENKICENRFESHINVLSALQNTIKFEHQNMNCLVYPSFTIGQPLNLNYNPLLCWYY